MRSLYRSILVFGLTFAALALGAGVLIGKAGREIPGTEIVYPMPESRLVFSHRTHADIDCLRCHKNAPEARTVAERLIPTEERCAECHAEAVRKSANEKGDAARCGLCHRDYDSLNKQRPSRVYWRDARLTFPHKAHIERMMACTACHSGVENSQTLNPIHMPSEASCLRCHKEWNTPGKCVNCHLQEPSGEIKTDFDGVHLVPGRGRLNHCREWMTRHVKEAQFNDKACKTCHQQKFCNSCHDGVLKPMRIHPEDYATMHPIDARKNRNRCMTCHRLQSFCLDCHQKLGVAKEGEQRFGRKQVHPDGWGDCVRGPNHHSFQAKRTFLSCVSCHTEGDCLQCHKSGARCAGGVNIHRHLSNGQLKRMQQKNPRACKKCHTER